MWQLGLKGKASFEAYTGRGAYCSVLLESSVIS
jgi:hypothetical protein